MHADSVQRSHILPAVLYIGIVVILFVLAMLYCGYQQVFRVKQIIVHGHYELEDRYVTRISGIKRGAGMFELDLATARDLLIAEPYIFNAYISRQFPDAVHIYVIERQPVALLELREMYALDAFATILPLPSSYAADKLPVISGIDPNLAVEPGKATVHPDIRHAIHFMNYMQQFGPAICEYSKYITWDNSRGWVIRKDRSHPPIYLGNEDLEERVDILNAFMTKMKDEQTDIRGFKYISLRYNGQVIVRD
ncbi:MAG: FtsQ-type POTRA domain-containing protein [FCB group bacterium]|nr:FtsQ-type POTRA domain-containing protein [FCB group bacterium]